MVDVCGRIPGRRPVQLASPLGFSVFQKMHKNFKKYALYVAVELRKSMGTRSVHHPEPKIHEVNIRLSSLPQVHSFNQNLVALPYPKPDRNASIILYDQALALHNDTCLS